MNAPSRSELIKHLQIYVKQHKIQIDSEFQGWESGVHAVLDCVFSSMADYKTTVLPTLKRFGEQPGMQDNPKLEFSHFIADVDKYNVDGNKFVFYAREIMKNEQEISGRTKVEVAYEVCKFFIDRGHETKASLKALPRGQPGTCETPPGEPGELECWVMEEMIKPGSAHKIRGMGPALGAYLLMNLGDEEHVKVDTMIQRVFTKPDFWKPRAGHPVDDKLIRDAVTCVARQMNTTPLRLDNALWRHESNVARERKG
ncbi:hypothetical protein, partial [Deinococcus frigens]